MRAGDDVILLARDPVKLINDAAECVDRDSHRIFITLSSHAGGYS